MIKKIICALLLVFVAAVTYFQNDQRVHAAVGAQVKKMYEEVGNCAVDFKVQSVNLFIPRVTLQDVNVKPKINSSNFASNSWSYQSQTLTLSCTWFSVLAYGIVDLYLDLRGMQGQSIINSGKVAILDEHLIPMIEAPTSDYPLFLKSIAFKDAHFDLVYPASHINIHFDWNSESKKIESIFKTNVHLCTGSLALANRSIVENIAGLVSFDTSYNGNGIVFDLAADCEADLVQLPHNKRTSFITGSWRDTKGMFAIKSADQSVKFEDISIDYDNQGVHVHTQGIAPISYALHVLDSAFDDISLCGECALEVTGLFTPYSSELQASSTMGQMSYGDIRFCDAATITCTKKDNQVTGDVLIERDIVGKINGHWSFDTGTNKGHCSISNIEPIKIPALPLWDIAQNAIKLNFDLDDTSLGQGLARSGRLLRGSYHAIAHNAILNSALNVQGAFSFDGDLWASIGALNNAKYECALRAKPHFQIKKLLYTDDQGKAMVDINADTQHHNEFQGSIKFELLQSIIKQFFDYNLQGQGAFNVQGKIADDSIALKTNLIDGSVIRLPETYNVIHSLSTDMHAYIKQKKLTVQDVHCQLYRGSLKMENAVATFDNAYNIAYLQAPIVFESCLLNIKKDLFALFSGTLNITKEIDQEACIKGNIIIERSQLKENLFSDKLQKKLFAFAGGMFEAKPGQNMVCDVSIETKEPALVDTAFFQAAAHTHLHVAGTIADPKLSGSVEMLSGSLAFPYKSLNIIKGHIYFLPDQMYDPIIELVASNKIKKYEVFLHVSGSLNNHHIALQSTPPLTDEQIVALLLVGSPEQSLNIVMPALLMQNLKTLLFESDQSPLRLNNIFKSWLKPLSRINLVPTFNDQAGRGGLRGALEIEINDRWRALVEKNFSLSEDTRFEVEYAASDDITVRGIRNERRDVGTEVEMKWKFGS